VLAEIGAGDIPQLLVFNKIDRIEGGAAEQVRALGQGGDGEGDLASIGAIDQAPAGRERVWISARDALGLDLLREALGERLGLQRVVGDILLPVDAGRLRARLHALDAVRGEQLEADGWRLQVDLPVADAARLAAQADGAPLRPLLPAIDTGLPMERDPAGLPVESDA
jgi:GTP-binding protein HflX